MILRNWAPPFGVRKSSAFPVLCQTDVRVCRVGGVAAIRRRSDGKAELFRTPTGKPKTKTDPAKPKSMADPASLKSRPTGISKSGRTGDRSNSRRKESLLLLRPIILIRSLLPLRSQVRKQDHVADGMLVRQKHHETIDPNTDSRRGRHTV